MSGFGGSVKLTGEAEYRKALKQIQVNLKEVSSELKLVSAQYDKNDNSTEALKARSEALVKQLSAQKSALASLESQYVKLTSEQAKNQQKHDSLVAEYEKEQAELKRLEDTVGTSSDEYKAQALVVANLAKDVDKSSQANARNEQTLSGMRTEMNNLKTSIAGTESEMAKADKATDELAESTEDAGDKAKKAGDGFTVFKGVVANLTASAIKGALSGLKKLGEGLINVGKEAYNAYSEFEQLSGGIETLFGDSARQVMKNAENAFKTAGMSANEYMSTVTSFSASLLKSLDNDTAKAVEYADMAIRDMSDNANKMGTSMESIQNAYNGFAKSNFTMLDNLKLGFSGSKEGAQQLIAEAEKLDSTFKAQRDSSGKLTLAYADMVDAIHIVQTQMGITGTTAKEADDTIEGSTKAMKASWQNLMIAVGDSNANMGKAVKNFTDSAEKWLKNSAPRVKTIIEGIFKAGKKLAKQYMPEVYNTVAPVLEKLGKALKDITTFITKNFSTIAPIVMTAVSAFTAFNAVMAISKTVTAVTTALSALTAGVGLATKAQTIYNAVLASNPIMAVVTAVLALVTAFALLSSKEDEASKAIREQNEVFEEQRSEIQSTVDSWNDLKDAQQKNIDAGMAEMDYYSSLARELKSITDANGKVKEGYEERASFIKDQLNEALGMEIEMTDNVIENYQGVMNAIDLLMDKKRAEIILNAQEALYQEALTERASALKKLNELQDDLNAKKAEAQPLLEQEAYWEAQVEEARKKGDAILQQQAETTLATYKNELQTVNKELEQAQTLYDEQKGVVSQYTDAIAIYEKNMAEAHAGNYDAMIEVNANYIKDYQNVEDAQRKFYEDAIANDETYLALLKEKKEQSGSDMYDLEIQQTEERLKANEDALKKYVQTNMEKTGEVELLWSDSLDDQLSLMTGYKIEFKDAGNGLIQMYVDGVATGEPTSKKEMAKIVEDSINEIAIREKNSKKAGEDLIDGLNEGVGNLRKRQNVLGSISNFGSQLISSLRNSLKEHSPSKASDEMGQFLLVGLQNGVKKQENPTLKQVAKFGQEVVDTLNGELEQGTSIGNITSEIQDAMPTTLTANALRTSGLTANALASTGGFDTSKLVDAFKTAMQGMEIEMGEDGFAQFVVKTITNEIYK